MNNIISIKNLSFNYGETPVLEELNLEVEKGEFLALLGHNGAGKSTLMKLALGLLKLQKGSISIFNTQISEFKDWTKVGYVQQVVEDFDFQFPATAEEIISLGRMGGKKGFLKSLDSKDKKSVQDAIKTIGIESLKNKKIGQLSGGQRQKVFLAKALASDAELLFLDEPTAGVDYSSQHKFYDLLQEINRELGITIILVTHDIGQIVQHVKRIVVLNKKVVFEGDPEKFSKSNFLTLTERI